MLPFLLGGLVGYFLRSGRSKADIALIDKQKKKISDLNTSLTEKENLLSEKSKTEKDADVAKAVVSGIQPVTESSRLLEAEQQVTFTKGRMRELESELEVKNELVAKLTSQQEHAADGGIQEIYERIAELENELDAERMSNERLREELTDLYFDKSEVDESSQDIQKGLGTTLAAGLGAAAVSQLVSEDASIEETKVEEKDEAQESSFYLDEKPADIGDESNEGAEEVNTTAEPDEETDVDSMVESVDADVATELPDGSDEAYWAQMTKTYIPYGIDDISSSIDEVVQASVNPTTTIYYSDESE